jgi:hypothetical protein
MFLAKTLSFYKQLAVQQALVMQAQDKEVSVKFTDYFGKRPDALFNEGDVLEFAKKKASSFHCSEELWHNPLHITTGMGKKEITELRKGWDLILDIDCPYWPLSKLITHLFIKALEAHDITSIFLKYSGNKGFHIAVPFEAFPAAFQGTPTKDLFPEAPRRIAYYLLDYIAKHYVQDEGDYLLFDNKYKITKEKLASALGKTSDELTNKKSEITTKKIPLLCKTCGYITRTEEQGITHICPVCHGVMDEEQVHVKADPALITFNPLSIIEVDTILIAHRHLYRMPYSFHEKSQLISVPIRKEDVLSFSKKQALPEHVDFNVSFLDRMVAKAGEANKLFIAAYDYDPHITEETNNEQKDYEIPTEAIPEEYFPPCIKAMLAGLKDGRKRALFTIINFLRGAGWSLEQIEATLISWNAKNDEPLRMVTIKGRIHYEKTKKEPLPPHNCKRYYQDFGVCKPDEGCERIKNPLQYAKIKAEKMHFGTKKGGRAKLTEEQKEMRRKHREKQGEA